MTLPGSNLALGWQYYQAGAMHEVEQVCAQVLQADPGCAEGWYLLGLARQASGKPADAVGYYRHATQLNASLHQAHYCLGNALVELGQLQEAVQSYQEVIRLHPQHAEAHNNLGAILANQGKLTDALPCYQQALGLKPAYADAYYNQGNALRELGRLEEALASYKRAIEINPAFAGAHLNLGIALATLGDLERAVAAYRQALQLQADYPEAVNALGLAMAHLGRLSEAVPLYEQALRLRPNFADAHNNRALAWLALGDFARGWPEYEWRWHLPGSPWRAFPQPVWDGSELNGRTILLHTEQGLGDTIQFIRYAPLVQCRGGKVVVVCQPMLVPLLKECAGIDVLIPRDSAIPPFDVHAPLMSLPRIFGTALETIPASIPYLRAATERFDYWRRELAATAGIKVGIVWQGSPGYRWDRHRSVLLHHFEHLARVPGVRLFSLQRGQGLDQLAGIGARFAVTDLASKLEESAQAFVETAAVMQSLDLVVTCDTATGHLAGALGIPVWIALATGPDWRWMTDRDDSPWYPTARLFRQTHAGDWDAVFKRMGAALHVQVQGRENPGG